MIQLQQSSQGKTSLIPYSHAQTLSRPLTSINYDADENKSSIASQDAL